MKYQGIIFDLDGTLLDTLQDLADSVNQALTDNDLPAHPLAAYNRFVGDGARTLCRRAMGDAGADPALLEQVLATFRRYYAQYRVRTTRPYDAIPQALETLQARGVRMAILSNKPQEDTVAVAQRYFPEIRFAAVVGQSDRVPPKPDPTGTRAALAALGLPREAVAYLGDSNTDMITAKNGGLYAVGACWGFRGAEELRAAGADLLLDSPAALSALFSEDAP